MSKREIADSIADFLALGRPAVSRGSSVDADFITEVLRVLDPTIEDLPNVYRRFEVALGLVGKIYEAKYDSSESRGRTGGGTITTTGYHKLLQGLLGEPACFILNVAENDVSSQYGDHFGEQYGFDSHVSGYRRLLGAGQTARVVFYRTGNSNSHPQCFVGSAEVARIDELEPHKFRAYFSGYAPISPPKPARDFEIDRWNVQDAIVQIEYRTYMAILGEALPPPTPGLAGINSKNQFKKDPAGIDELLEALPPVDAVVDDLSSRSSEFPEDLPIPNGPAAPEVLGGLSSGPRAIRGRFRSSSDQRRLDTYTEKRAVNVATQYLEAMGWKLEWDCQEDRVGYDLQFRKDGRELDVEVKGIQGSNLAFNLTRQEWLHALGNVNFVLVAVTDILDPPKMKVHLLTRDVLQRANRTPLQFRMRIWS